MFHSLSFGKNTCAAVTCSIAMAGSGKSGVHSQLVSDTIANAEATVHAVDSASWPSRS